MIKYTQPSFYHFNSDSIALVDLVLLNHKDSKDLKIADFGAGCGIIAIDFALKHENVSEIFFIEVQESFIPSLEENVKLLPANIKVNIINKPFIDINFQGLFDIAFSNPPYFSPRQGKASPNFNKQISRTFEIDSFEILIERMRLSLKHEGRGYFVLRDSPLAHDEDLLLLEVLNNAKIYELVRK